MQNYETVIVVHPRFSDAEAAEFSEKTKQIISKEGGEILSEDKWGRRKLAYPIRHQREGYYLYLKYRAPGQLIAKLNQQFRILQDTVLRSLTVHAEEPKARPAKPPKAAAASATAAPAA